MRALRPGFVAMALALIAAPASAAASPRAATDAPPGIIGPPELLEQGRAAQRALAPLKQGLMETLQAALAKSPAEAVGACQLAAPGIAAGASTPAYTVGRTSDRLRNPKNAPEPWMEPLLAKYAAAPRDPLVGTVVALDGGAVGYVEPIHLKPLCTTCHGAAIEPGLAAEIRARYPEDRATGYAEGDFRGLFWVVAKPASGER